MARRRQPPGASPFAFITRTASGDMKYLSSAPAAAGCFAAALTADEKFV